MMTALRSTRYYGVFVKAVWAAAIALPIAAAAQSGAPATADPAWVAGPSSATIFQAVKFKGGRYAANATMVVRVRGPGGAEQVIAVTTSADGALECDVVPSVPGPHTLTVVDGTGRVVATTNFLAGA